MCGVGERFWNDLDMVADKVANGYKMCNGRSECIGSI